MALIGNISGSSDLSYQVGVTGTLIVGRPNQGNTHLPDAHDVAPDAVLFVSGAIGGRGNSGDDSASGIGVAVFGGDTYISGALVVENHDVNGGVRVKPEKVLKQDRVTTERRVKNTHP